MSLYFDIAEQAYLLVFHLKQIIQEKRFQKPIWIYYKLVFGRTNILIVYGSRKKRFVLITIVLVKPKTRRN